MEFSDYSNAYSRKRKEKKKKQLNNANRKNIQTLECGNKFSNILKLKPLN